MDLDKKTKVSSYLFHTSRQILNKQFPKVVQSLQLFGLK